MTQVEFFANGVSIGVDTTSPFQFDWSGVAAGTYAITAVVTDSNGATATSAARTITVAGTNTAPTVSLSTPADNSRYLNPSSVTLSATASGPELNDIIQSVAFYLNGSLAQTITSAPFTYDASGLAAGTYTLTAVATDSQGAQTTSAQRTFTVSSTNTPPTVSLVIPQDNTNWKTPATVTFQASVNSGEANDTVSVEFFANGTSLGTRSSSPFSLSSSMSAGTYTITAVATDGQGAQTTSTARTINVSDTNLPPTVTITSPAANANFPNPPVASISITSSASGGEINDSVSKVEFYANGTLIGTRTFGPFNFTWTNVAQGNYSLTAIAYDSANATTTSAPVPIKVGNPASLAFIEVDHLNTPRAVYDASQQLRWKWDQAEPFGVTSANEDPSSLGAYELPVRFPGQYADKETGVSQNWNRDYWAEGGRYVEADPIGLRGGLNMFAYVGGSPLTKTDPPGLWWPGLHNSWSYTQALENGFSDAQARDLGNLTGDVDSAAGSQTAQNSNWHAMKDPKWSIQEAKQRFDDYVASNLAVCTPEGLARALHAIQDSYSPAHSGFKNWPGMPALASTVTEFLVNWAPMMVHGVRDGPMPWNFPEMVAAKRATSAAIQKWRTKCSCSAP